MTFVSPAGAWLSLAIHWRVHAIPTTPVLLNAQLRSIPHPSQLLLALLLVLRLSGTLAALQAPKPVALLPALLLVLLLVLQRCRRKPLQQR